MLFIPHAIAVKAQIRPGRVVFVLSNADLFLDDEEVTVFVPDEVFLVVQRRKLLFDKFPEPLVIRLDTGDESDLAGMILCIEKIQVVCCIVSRVNQAGIDIDAKRFVEDGNELYLSSNGVWQAKVVPPEYFTIHYI